MVQWFRGFPYAGFRKMVALCLFIAKVVSEVECPFEVGKGLFDGIEGGWVRSGDELESFL